MYDEIADITRCRVGRPKLPGSLKAIRLRESVFNLWRDRKEALGFQNAQTVSLQNFCYIFQGEVCSTVHLHNHNTTVHLHNLRTCTPLVPLLTSNYFPVLPIHVPRQHSYLIFFPFLIRSNTIRESTDINSSTKQNSAKYINIASMNKETNRGLKPYSGTS